MNTERYQWATKGDINAFFGLMLDNMTNMILTVSLLAAPFTFAFPVDFAIRYMIPGTAIGVMVGDLLYFFLAFWLAGRCGSRTVTAMPLGLDTPSTIGMVFFVLGPAYVTALGGFEAEGIAKADAELMAAKQAWYIGICCIVASGIFKVVCSVFSGLIRRVVPRAGLLGSLAAIALVLIAFIPTIDNGSIFAVPLVGFCGLAIILATLVAKVRLPFNLPGAFGALLVATVIYYIMFAVEKYALGDAGFLLGGMEEISFDPAKGLLPTEWLGVFSMEWTSAIGASLKYMPIVLPFALGTVIGGIDCTESAAAAGDDYNTGVVIFIEAIATLAAGFCGGVQQSTPYIGHPAYKEMGGRAAYCLMTALFIGAAGLLGFFGYLFVAIPKPALVPILVFIGLEITAQSFHATPKRHYAALGFACIPAMATLVHIMVSDGSVDAGIFDNVGKWLNIRMLYSGFIITSLIWASALAFMIDKRLKAAAAFMILAGLFTLVGLIHSPYSDGRFFKPTMPDFAAMRVESEAESKAEFSSGEIEDESASETNTETDGKAPENSDDSSNIESNGERNSEDATGNSDASDETSKKQSGNARTDIDSSFVFVSFQDESDEKDALDEKDPLDEKDLPGSAVQKKESPAEDFTAGNSLEGKENTTLPLNIQFDWKDFQITELDPKFQAPVYQLAASYFVIGFILIFLSFLKGNDPVSHED